MEGSGSQRPVNTQKSSPHTAVYRCPDELHPITRAVHLGRLAAFYPACRQCPLRDDTGTLSPRQVAQLAETGQQRQTQSVFSDEGVGGVYLNDLTPAAARDIAAAFGVLLRGEGRGTGGGGPDKKGEGRGERGRELQVRNPKSEIRNPKLPIPNPQSLIPRSSLLGTGGR